MDLKLCVIFAVLIYVNSERITNSSKVCGNTFNVRILHQVRPTLIILNLNENCFKFKIRKK